MSDLGDQAGAAALWKRWRLHVRPGAPEAAVDPLLLAAYAEGRLDESQAEPVEEWLFAHPEALADLAAVRSAAATASVFEAPAAMVTRAAALVEPRGEATIHQFRAVTARRWRIAVAWGSMAASLLATSLVGFEIGNSAYLNFVGTSQTAAESTLHELLDPPAAVFGEEEEPAT